MPEKEVVDYIKENLAKGYTEEQLTAALLGQGRDRAGIEEAFAAAREAPQEKTASWQEEPVQRPSWQKTPEPEEETPPNTTATHIKRITMIVLVLLALGAAYYFFIFKR